MARSEVSWGVWQGLGEPWLCPRLSLLESVYAASTLGPEVGGEPCCVFTVRRRRICPILLRQAEVEDSHGPARIGLGFVVGAPLGPLGSVSFHDL